MKRKNWLDLWHLVLVMAIWERDEKKSLDFYEIWPLLSKSKGLRARQQEVGPLLTHGISHGIIGEDEHGYLLTPKGWRLAFDLMRSEYEKTDKQLKYTETELRELAEASVETSLMTGPNSAPQTIYAVGLTEDKRNKMIEGWSYE